MSRLQPWPYRKIGQPNRHALIFLHGFMGAGNDWSYVAEQCATHFFCILPDLPGHGQNTDLSHDQQLGFHEIAEGLVNLLDQLDLGQVTLVGYSMGGRIALFTAIHHPDRIKAVVLESCSPGLAEPQARRDRAELDDQRAETILSTGLGNFVDNWYNMTLFQTIKSQPDLFRRTIARRKANDAAWVARIVRDLSPGRQPSVWSELGNLSAPALLWAGALNSEYARLMQLMAEKIPGSKVEIVPNAGHNIHLEQPDRFVQGITDFLQRPPLWLIQP